MTDWVGRSSAQDYAIWFYYLVSFQAGIGKPGTQNPGPGQVLKTCFVPSRNQKNDATMWRNRHICTKFQENLIIFGSTKKSFFETWQRHIEPGMWRNVTKMWRHIISSPSLTQTQVQVLRKFRLGTTLNLVRAFISTWPPWSVSNILYNSCTALKWASRGGQP